MSRNSKTLKIVSNRGAGAANTNTDLVEFVEQWRLLDQRLSNLISQQDAQLSKHPIDKASVESLQVVITKAEQEQEQMLTELAKRPGKSIEDVVAKLEIWNLIHQPSADDWSQPSHHLVTSALSDLQRHADKFLG